MPGSGVALLVVDVQNDFLPPNGSLAVGQGDEIIPLILKLLEDPTRYDLIAATLDYHPVGHISFASTHGAAPFTLKDVPKLHSEGETVKQMLWPDHCVQNTPGCDFEASVQQRLNELGDKVQYIRKGENIAVDAYSGFADNQYMHFTNLPELLFTHGIKEVIVVGLATDYCVKATAIDARKFGFRTVVVQDAMRAVDPTANAALFAEMERWGCRLTTAGEVLSS